MKKRILASIGLISCSLLLALPSYAEESSLSEKGKIEFTGEYKTEIHDPEKPDEIVEPDDPITPVGGDLRLEHVLTLDFGYNKITKEEATYFTKAQTFRNDASLVRANYVQLSDYRTNNGGWTLTVKQEHQFRNQTDTNLELTGAQLSFDKAWISSTNANITDSEKPTVKYEAYDMVPGGDAYEVAKAEKGVGGGTWMISFGSSGETEGILNTLFEATDPKGTYMKNNAVSLTIPGETIIKPVKYQTVLTWTLSELP